MYKLIEMLCLQESQSYQMSPFDELFGLRCVQYTNNGLAMMMLNLFQ